MNNLTSLYLDLVRVLAAFCVVFHHYNNHIIDVNRQVFPNVGQEAVIVFFVLSGFVISWVVEVKDKKVTIFLAKRFARFYSVMIPSLGIIFLSYLITISINPDIYPDYINVGMNFVLPKIITTLGFLNYNSFLYDVRLPTASPFWSLTYEFWYYIILATIIFIPKKKIAFLCCFGIFIFLGIKPLLLWPTWLLGSLTYHISKKVKWRRRFASQVFLLSLISLVLLHQSSIRSKLSMSNLFGISSLHHSEDSLYLFLLALTISLNFIAFISWSKSVKFTTINPFLEKCIRYPAGVSFTLYLTHLPLMFLLKAVLGGTIMLYLIPSLTIILVLIFGSFIENSKFWYYKQLKSLFQLSKKYTANF